MELENSGIDCTCRGRWTKLRLPESCVGMRAEMEPWCEEKVEDVASLGKLDLASQCLPVIALMALPA